MDPLRPGIFRQQRDRFNWVSVAVSGACVAGVTVEVVHQMIWRLAG
jgi:hypothetical protein